MDEGKLSKLDDASVTRAWVADRQRRLRVLSLLVVLACLVLLGRASISHRSTASEVPRFVEVEGSAPRPGLYALPAGSTVAQVLEQAGTPAPPGSQPILDQVLTDGTRVFREADGTLSLQPAGRRLLLGLRLDANTASAAALEALPGVGPSLALAIVTYREEHGPFSRFEDLDHVSGLGPALLERIRAFVEVVPSSAAAPGPPVPEPALLIDLNSATLADFESLPGIGPSKAQAILDYRNRHGGFHNVRDLVRVKGIGPKTLKRLRPLVTIDRSGAP